MITAIILVWKRHEITNYLVNSIYNMRGISEIILWNNDVTREYKENMFKDINIVINNSNINKITLGRYEAAAMASNNIIYVQDDDQMPTNISKMYINYLKSECSILANCPQTHWLNIPRNKFVGWGSIFEKDSLNIFKEYKMYFEEDEILYREADLLFTNMNTYKKVLISPKLIVKEDSRALCQNPKHYEYHQIMLERVEKIKKERNNDERK